MAGSSARADHSSDTTRVVHLVNQLGRGGTERQLYLLLRALRDVAPNQQHRVVGLNPAPDGWAAPLRDAGVDVLELPSDCRGVLRRVRRLCRELRPFRPHVVHSWSAHDNPYAAVVGRLLGAKANWGSLRNSLRTEGVRSLSPASRWLMLRSVQRLVVNSRALVEELRDAGLGERAVLLPNCVEENRAEEKRTKRADLAALGIGDGEPLVGVVANPQPRKNLPMFLRALAAVRERRPDVRGLVLGTAVDPAHGEELRREAGRLGLGSAVVFADSRPDVDAVLRRLDVVCLSSDHEGMPNAVLEAMAAARPVVATAVGGVPELIRDQENGRLVPPGDAPAMADAVVRLLDDPESAAALGREARRGILEDHACDTVAGRLARLYADAVPNA